MNWRLPGLVAVALGAVALALHFAGVGAPMSVTKRYAVDIELITSDGVYTGKTVWEETLTARPSANPNALEIFARVVGEAVVASNAAGDRLLVLKRQSRSFSSPAFGAFLESCLDTWSSAEDLVRRMAAFTGGCEVKRRPVVAFNEDALRGSIRELPYCDEAAVPTCIRDVTYRVHTTDQPVQPTVAQDYPDLLANLHAYDPNDGIWGGLYYKMDLVVEPGE